MKVEFTTGFIKIFKRRLRDKPKLKEKFFARTRLFNQNPQNSILKNHPLKGTSRGLFAFSITGDTRVIYRIENNIAYFLDIGSHN